MAGIQEIRRFVFVFAFVFVCVYVFVFAFVSGCVCDISCYVDTLLAGVQGSIRFRAFKDESGSSALALERSDMLNKM